MTELDRFLDRCAISSELREHVRAVFESIPDSIRTGLMSDQQFILSEWDNTARDPAGFALPSPSRTPVRAVILKRRMWRRDPPFIRWVIAHELAHAHLGNRGRHPGEDPETAADALAAEWGFLRP